MRPALLALMLLAACDDPGAPDQPARRVAPPPRELCEQTRKGLEELGASGAIFYDAKGEATLPFEAWARMKAEQRSQFARMLAFHAACSSPDGAPERQVRIRSETGTILSEAIVPVTIDLGAIE